MNSKEIALVKKDTVDIVASKIKEFQENREINLPDHYSPENAMKSAWLTLQKTTAKAAKDDYRPVLEYCTKDSIANSLLSMVVQGLSPAKNQCYFIAYKNELQLQRSYFGTMAVTKRLNEVKDIRSQVIYADDEFELQIENGEKRIAKHIQKLANIDVNKIVGAYAIIEKTNGTVHTEVMSMAQIKAAWGQSSMYPVDDNGNLKANSTHSKFTDQMVLKTVINRACKYFANTSDDSDLLIEHFNKATENEYPAENKKNDILVQNEIEDNANKEELDFINEEPAEIIDADSNEVEENLDANEGPGF